MPLARPVLPRSHRDRIQVVFSFRNRAARDAGCVAAVTFFIFIYILISGKFRFSSFLVRFIFTSSVFSFRDPSADCSWPVSF
jgi:hypothetical protein